MNDQNITLVVAEDDFLVCDHIQRILQNSKYTIIGKASNGEEAVQQVLDLNPDLILMDIKMPKMDGLEASRLISEQHPLPIMILTAYESPDLVEEASRAGVSAFLTKPLKFETMDNAVTVARARHHELMELRRLNRELQEALDENAILKGFLSICSVCNKIKDKENNWIPLDRYIVTHTRTVISHGMCEQCSSDLYGNEPWYKAGRAKDKIVCSKDKE